LLAEEKKSQDDGGNISGIKRVAEEAGSLWDAN
jgi:hypothetical protein